VDAINKYRPNSTCVLDNSDTQGFIRHISPAFSWRMYRHYVPCSVTSQVPDQRQSHRLMTNFVIKYCLVRTALQVHVLVELTVGTGGTKSSVNADLSSHGKKWAANYHSYITARIYTLAKLITSLAIILQTACQKWNFQTYTETKKNKQTPWP
jgi:hypothetical protein